MKEIIPDRVFFYSSATLGEHHRKETLQANVRFWHEADLLTGLEIRFEREVGLRLYHFLCANSYHHNRNL